MTIVMKIMLYHMLPYSEHYKYAGQCKGINKEKKSNVIIEFPVSTLIMEK